MTQSTSADAPKPIERNIANTNNDGLGGKVAEDHQEGSEEGSDLEEFDVVEESGEEESKRSAWLQSFKKVRGRENTRTLLQKARSELKQQKSQIRSMQEDMDRMRAIIHEKDDLLNVRAGELESMRAYLATDDAMPINGVVEMAKKLNAEVYQTASMIVDVVSGMERVKKNADRHYQWLSDRINVDLERILQDPSHEDDYLTILQAVLQHGILRTCTLIPMKWVMENTLNRLFKKLHRKLKDTELPSVSARWQILTRSTLRTIDADYYRKEKEKSILTGIKAVMNHILAIAGIQEPSDSQFFSKLHPRFLELVKLTMEFDRAIGEGVASTEIVPILHSNPTLFDPSLMDDAYAEPPKKGKKSSRTTHKTEEHVDRKGSSGTKKPIFCSTEIGLRGRTVQPNANSQSTTAVESILLKPKVVIF